MGIERNLKSSNDPFTMSLFSAQLMTVSFFLATNVAKNKSCNRTVNCIINRLFCARLMTDWKFRIVHWSTVSFPIGNRHFPVTVTSSVLKKLM